MTERRRRIAQTREAWQASSPSAPTNKMMKKLLVTLLVSQILFLFGCAEQKPISDVIQEDSPYSEGAFLKFTYSRECFVDAETEQGNSFSCENMGKATIDNIAGGKVEILPVSESEPSPIYFAFSDENGPIDISRKTLVSMTAETQELPSYNVFFLDSSNVYIWERNFALSFYDGAEWQDLDLPHAILSNLSEAYKKEAFAIVKLAVSSDYLKASIWIDDGEDYKEIPNYEMVFDRKDLAFLNANSL